jgi:hypothetical protein
MGHLSIGGVVDKVVARHGGSIERERRGLGIVD